MNVARENATGAYDELILGIVNLLKNQDHELEAARWATLDAISEIKPKDPRVKQTLLELLDDPAPSIAEKALVTLRVLGVRKPEVANYLLTLLEKGEAKSITAIQAVLVTQLGSTTLRAKRVLLKTLDSPSPETHPYAAYLLILSFDLTEREYGKAADSLLVSLKSPNYRIRQNAEYLMLQLERDSERIQSDPRFTTALLQREAERRQLLEGLGSRFSSNGNGKGNGKAGHVIVPRPFPTYLSVHAHSNGKIPAAAR